MVFRVEEHSDTEIIKGLFVEYSHIKGAESCFVSFDKELNDLEGYYSGGGKETQESKMRQKTSQLSGWIVERYPGIYARIKD